MERALGLWNNVNITQFLILWHVEIERKIKLYSIPN
jgi:hypothetical protein